MSAMLDKQAIEDLKAERDRALRLLTAARAENAELRALLASLEYVTGNTEDVPWCGVCGGFQHKTGDRIVDSDLPIGHQPDCPLAKALKK